MCQHFSLGFLNNTCLLLHTPKTHTVLIAKALMLGFSVWVFWGSEQSPYMATLDHRPLGGRGGCGPCDHIYIYIYGTPPPPLTYHFASFERQEWVGAGCSLMERRPANASF